MRSCREVRREAVVWISGAREVVRARRWEGGRRDGGGGAVVVIARLEEAEKRSGCFDSVYHA